MTQFRYFGMIAEAIGKSEESILLPQKELDVRSFIVEQYPQLKNMVFTLAINQQLVDKIPQGFLIQEVAVLPPFAGG